MDGLAGSGPGLGHGCAVVLSIGDELVIGQTVDTNSARISGRLRDLGVRVLRHETLDDSTSAIVSAIDRAVVDADLVVITGGLGPTADDLTRDALARVLSEPLVVDEDAMATLEARYSGAGRVMAEGNRRQVLRPASARMLANPHGTAPGLHARVAYDGIPSGSSDVFCLPGPPREMKPMFEAEVVPTVPASGVVATRVLRTFGLGESDLADRLSDLMERSRNPLVGTTASGGVVSVRMRCEGVADAVEAERLLDADEAAVRERLEDYVFGAGEDTLEGVIVREALERGVRVTACESCTGGMVASRLTAVPGSSAVFDGAVVTYSNERKALDLGVDAGLIEEHGAVSREVAAAMARGGCERIGTDGNTVHSVAITGIAGPDGGSEVKPVGTVWIATCSAEGRALPEVRAVRFVFPGEREDVRGRATVAALGLLLASVRGVEPGALLWAREAGVG